MSWGEIIEGMGEFAKISAIPLVVALALLALLFAMVESERCKDKPIAMLIDGQPDRCACVWSYRGTTTVSKCESGATYEGSLSVKMVAEAK